MPAIPFNREAMLRQLAEVPEWDVLVIGGGSTGLGTALDAASRGYKTLLLEQSDFARALRAAAPSWCMVGCVTWRRQYQVGVRSPSGA
ncbi:Glycerol-3-phosphate dehydrogenase, partial [Pontibacter sp. BAB1700]